jgi:chromosome segregation protein
VREESEVEAERLALTEELTELSAAKEELFALSNKADLGAQRAQHYMDEARSLAERAQAARAEVEDLERRAQGHGGEIADLGGRLSQLDTEAEARQQAWQQLDSQHDELRSHLVATRQRLDRATADAAGALTRAARLESEIEAAAAKRDDLGNRLAAVGQQDGQLGADAERAADEQAAAAHRLERLRERQQELADRRSEAQARATTLRQDLSRGEIELDTLREESHRRRSRLQSLSEIQSRYESFQRGVRAIMKQYREGITSLADADSAGHTDGQDTVGPVRPWSDGAVKGLVADIVQPPPELETAVEAVLGDRLGNIIVESHEVGIDAIDFLKSRSEGRSSFIPLTLRAPASAGGGQGMQLMHDGSGLAAATETGTARPLLELIGYDREYHKVAAYLLGDVLVCDDLKQALALWRETHTDKTIVTLDGEVIDPHGVVTGGSREHAVAGILSQKREIRELEEVVARVEADLEAARGRQISLKQSLAIATAQLEAIDAEVREDDVARVGEQKDLDRARREAEQLGHRRNQLAGERNEIEAVRVRTEERIQAAREALDADRRAAVDAEALGLELRTETVALTERLDAMVGELASLKVAASQAADRQRTARETLHRLEREREEYVGRRERLERSAGRGDRPGRGADRGGRAPGGRGGAVPGRGRGAGARPGRPGRRRRRSQRRPVPARGRAARGPRAGEQARPGAELAAAALPGGQSAPAFAGGAGGRPLSRCPAGGGGDRLSPASPGGREEEARMNELRGLIERMGEINLTAIEESAELSKRFDYLTSQRADLDSAIGQLESAIEKINKASKRRFREVFDAVNEKFQDVFPRCFGGGKAKLALTDESDLLETGIEIIANPPGKKVMQSLELLSGGEKAMTAVSLLFAIFLVKPSPFCVLDEVDAPLDEANVIRLNAMLREMTDRRSSS